MDDTTGEAMTNRRQPARKRHCTNQYHRRGLYRCDARQTGTSVPVFVHAAVAKNAAPVVTRQVSMRFFSALDSKKYCLRGGKNGKRRPVGTRTA
ncbi:hypothetical protein ACFOLG_02930 [Vogesella facilis]|uniref:Uncharacterized protein n=1 Tax=Vogesella facilis TaxID=1655232 RepID=A0ABV7RA99_9NEIS